ncbi:hypothetical protein H0H87_007729, partial [Tephrocybe sp. NHM501043]
RIHAREVVLVHAQAPDEVLELPRGAYTHDLENEPAIVVEEVTHLREELRVALEQMMRALSAKTPLVLILSAPNAAWLTKSV